MASRRTERQDKLDWLVVGAAFVSYGIISGNVKALGVLLLSLTNDLDCELWIVGWIAVLFCTMRTFLAPFVAAGLSRFDIGSRFTIMAGGFLASLGFILASYTSNLVLLAIFIVGLSGFGTACTWFSMFALLAARYRVALAISSMGQYPFGMIVYGPVTQTLLETYGWRGTMMLTGGMTLNLMVCGALVKREPPTLKPREYQEVHVQNEDNPDETSSYGRNGNAVDSDYKLSKSRTQKEGVNFYRRLVTTLDFSVLRNVRFSLLTAGKCLCEFCFSGWMVYMVSHGQFQGLSGLQTSFLPTAFGIGNILGKALTPFLQRIHSKLSTSFWACVGNTLMCVFFVANALITSFAGQMATTGWLALCYAVTYQEIDVMTMFLMSGPRIVAMLGWQTFFAGLSGSVGGLVASWLYEWTGDFKSSLFMYSGIMCSLVPVFIINAIYTKRLRQTELGPPTTSRI